jgi:tetratricopeptide (TPR) repeat protein
VEPLYGRAEILARTRLAVERAVAGQGQLLLLTGEPGIGKSRLAEQVALEASNQGAVVAWGRCWEAGGAPAYWPWIQLFRSLTMDEDPFAGAAADVAVGASEARFSAFDRAVRGLQALAARRPLVLVLDDLHAADAPSLLLLLMLARELARCPILVVGAYRDAELRLALEIAALLAKIAREAVLIPLTRLGPEDIALWLGEVAGTAGSAQAADLYRVTEGHPLFVVEALRLGRGAEAQAAWSLGPSAVLDERLAGLSAATHALLQVAAVLGREFSLDELVETAGTDPDLAHHALSEALATNIVVPARDAGYFRFSHVLLRDRLYAELLPSTRATLHFQAGSVCLARGGEAQAAVHHLFEGQSAGGSERIAEVALAAATAALSRLAFEDAAHLCRRALRLPTLDALPALVGELQIVLAEALIRVGETEQGKALCVEAAAHAERTGAHELLARAALVYGTELASGTLDRQMIALLRRALAALDEADSGLRSRVMARLSAALTPPESADDGPEILALMQESTRMARRLGDRHTLLYALQFAATAGLLVPEQERFALLEETLSLARALEQPLVLLHTLPAYITELLALGERRAAEAMLPDYAALLRESRQPLHRVRYLIVSALLLELSGDVAEAERVRGEAGALAQRTGGATLFSWLVHRLSCAQLRGQPELLASDSSALLGGLELLTGAGPYCAWLLAGTGRREEAITLLYAADLTPASIASFNLWTLLGASETCVLLGDVALGTTTYPHLERAVDRMFWAMAPGSLIGPSALVLGNLAQLIGKADDAVRHYDEAIAFCEKLGAPLLIERCRTARAAALTGATQTAHAMQASRAVPPQIANPLQASLAVPPPSAHPVQTSRAIPPPSAAADPDAALPAMDNTAPVAVFSHEGEVWTVSSRAGTTLRLKHSKGLSYLNHLVEQAGRPVHVLELVGLEHRTGDAGPVLDPRAKAEYRARLDELREELTEAQRFADAARVARAEREIEAIAEQLAGAVGLGGRDRRAASDVERLRINVQRRIKDAIDRIAEVDPALGRQLSAAVKTGTTCIYLPL